MAAEQIHNVAAALAAPPASTRLQAAMAAGSTPDDRFIAPLIHRCGIEPDFFVREMLTWALTRLDADATVAALCDELTSPHPQARSQALHTLSKIGDRRAWPAITTALLYDADDDVARTAWRTATVLVPDDDVPTLIAALVSQLGRGDIALAQSLSKALVALGEAIVEPVTAASRADSTSRRVHAHATLALLHDPEAGFPTLFAEAERRHADSPQIVALTSGSSHSCCRHC